MRTARLSTNGIYASVRPSLMSIPFLSGSCAQPIPAEQSTEENYVPMPEPWSNGPDFFDGGYPNAQPILAEQSTEGDYVPMLEPWSNGPDFFDGGYPNAQPILAEQSTEGDYVPMLEPWSNGPDFFDGGYSNAQPITAEQPTEEAVQATSHPLTLYPIEVIPPHSKFQQTSL